MFLKHKNKKSFLAAAAERTKYLYYRIHIQFWSIGFINHHLFMDHIICNSINVFG